MIEQEIIDDVGALLSALPPHITTALQQVEDLSGLLEVVMDLGREPTARFRGREVTLTATPVGEADIEFVIARIGAFGDDNRAGIERTLHRISAMRNRTGRVVGLTCRIGRAVFGTIAILRDIVESGKSMLLLGKPGVGKTTMLREVARVLADEAHKRVIIVDTSNEIAGDGDIPHPGIGRARRMQVATPTVQHAVMIEAVENHMPEVIVIDEIGTELEAQAARTIAERGVQLVGTAHGNTLENLMQNPTLSDLIGGIQTVTLGDEEARRRGTQKSVLERKAPPTFDVVVEIQDWHNVTVHPDVATTVDAILLNRAVTVQVRTRDDEGTIRVTEESPPRPLPGNGRANGRPLPRRGAFTAPAGGDTWGPSAGPGDAIPIGVPRSALNGGGRGEGAALGAEAAPARAVVHQASLPPLRIYPFGVSRVKLEEVARDMHLPVAIAADIRDADLVMTLKNYYRKKPQPLRDAEAAGVSIYVLKNNTSQQMETCLLGVYNISGPPAGNPATVALEEAEEAINHVMDAAQPVDLAPQNAYVRRLQHRLAERYNLQSRSRGREPHRRVRIFPGAADSLDG
jgi:stage III sporulation protein SpoIIIAA